MWSGPVPPPVRPRPTLHKGVVHPFGCSLQDVNQVRAGEETKQVAFTLRVHLSGVWGPPEMTRPQSTEDREEAQAQTHRPNHGRIGGLQKHSSRLLRLTEVPPL